MPKKSLAFTYRPDGQYGMKLGITFTDGAVANNSKFVVGDGQRFVTTIQELPGGATVMATESQATFQNFPIVIPDGSEKMRSGSPTLRVTLTVQSDADKVSFNITNLDAAIPGFFPTIQIENQNLLVGESNEFSLT